MNDNKIDNDSGLIKIYEEKKQNKKSKLSVSLN